jgi:uncharacterized protein YegP (UPF0339 family)
MAKSSSAASFTKPMAARNAEFSPSRRMLLTTTDTSARPQKNGQPFFVLKAANGETIGRSEMYSSASAMENGIASVKRNAATATVDDLT